MTSCAYGELVALAFGMQVVEMSAWGEINRKELRTYLEERPNVQADRIRVAQAPQGLLAFDHAS